MIRAKSNHNVFNLFGVGTIHSKTLSCFTLFFLAMIFPACTQIGRVSDHLTDGQPAPSLLGGGDDDTPDGGASSGRLPWQNYPDMLFATEAGCPAGSKSCGPLCVNLNTDPENCGACGNSCGYNGHCTGGQCSCPPPYSNCNSTWSDGCEINTDTDPRHCGECQKTCPTFCAKGSCCNESNCTNCPGNVCGLGGFCEQSSGSCQSCKVGLLNCDGDPKNACEVNSFSDLKNCGKCGLACKYHQRCSQGVCDCQTDYADCDGLSVNGCEANLTNSTKHCGKCGAACDANQQCNKKSCVCAAGYADCDGKAENGCETKVSSDPKNCGSCNNSCHTNQACSNSKCVCNSNYGDCNNIDSDGCETLLDDDKNCGKCGASCSTAQVCKKSFFGGYTCALCLFSANCDQKSENGCETNRSSDVKNCGKCGVECDAPQSCINGTCKEE